VEESDDADEVWDLLNRHVTLRDANRDLMTQVTTGEDAIEGLRSELQVHQRLGPVLLMYKCLTELIPLS